MVLKHRWVRLRTVCFGVLLAALCVAGCAKNGTVSGKVTLPDGSPLPGGQIAFQPEDTKRNPVIAVIKEDGTYSCSVPVGNCKVSIDNRAIGKSSAPIGAGGVPAPPKGGGGPGAGAKSPTGPMKGPPGGAIKGGPSGPTGPPGGGGGGGPVGKAGHSDKELKGGNAAIGDAMSKVGANKAENSEALGGRLVPINPKYYDNSTSGLSIEVSGGSNTFDVKLDK